MRIIGLAGRARSGKSTVAMRLVDAHGYVDYDFAAPIKAGLKAMFGLTDEQLYGEDKETVIPWIGMTPRRLLQTLGTEWGRELVARDLWVRRAGRWLNAVPRFYPGVVFGDVRFEEEAAMIRARGGRVVHVRRKKAPKVADHASELGIKVVEGDLVLPNDGTLDELYARIDDLW